MARNFNDVLADIEGGQLHRELTDALASLTEGVADRRKAGEITLKLKLKPNGETGVEVDASVTVKEPARNRGKSFFFIADGSLVRDDPRQRKLPLKAVGGDENEAPAAVRELPETPATPLREVS